MKDFLKKIKEFKSEYWQEVVEALNVDKDFFGARKALFKNFYDKVYDDGVLIALYSIHKLEDDTREPVCKVFFFDEFNCYSVVGKKRIKLEHESKNYATFLEKKFGKRYKSKRESKINDEIKTNQNEMAIQ